jgi:molybdopterin/thiamine biosynthesis adenylyltransferase
MLTDVQVARYSRQIILPAVGGRGQQQLLSAAVTVAGQSGMARAAAVYLAAAGIGRLFLIGAERMVGTDLETLNPDCHVTNIERPLADAAANQIVGQSRAVVCANADVATIALLATQCLVQRRPLVYGQASGAFGDAALIGSEQGGGPCYECFSQQGARARTEGADASCTGTAAADHAVFADAIGGFIGSIVATEVIKLTLNLGSTLMSRRLTYDALAGRMSTTDIHAVPTCAMCGSRRVGVPSG